MINIVQVVGLMLLALFVVLVGIHGSRLVGWWAWLPAYLVGLLLGLLACASGVREIRASVKGFREKLRNGRAK